MLAVVDTGPLYAVVDEDDAIMRVVARCSRRRDIV
jgi:hypothetical protein